MKIKTDESLRGLRQGYLFSLAQFNINLGEIMKIARENEETETTINKKPKHNIFLILEPRVILNKLVSCDKWIKN